MKCFKFLLLFISINTFADTYIVLPKDVINAKASLGDIITIEIINQDNPGVTPEGKRIGPVFYIMEKIDERSYRVVVSPENKKKNTNQEVVDKFEYRGFEFSKDISNYTNEFVTKEVEYKLSDKKNFYWVYLILSLLLFPYLVKLLIILYKKSVKKKKRLQEKNRAKRMLNSVKTRSDIENLYIHRKKIFSVLSIKVDDADKFSTKLNEVQYKKNWDEEDLKKVREALSYIKDRADGI